jgi:hypothetical protein
MATKEQLKDNAKIFFDDTKNITWFDAIGDGVTKFLLPVHSPTDDTTGDPSSWTLTVTEAGTGNSTIVNSTTQSNRLLITTAANEYDGVNFQGKGEPFKLVSTNKLYFGCKMSISDATQSDLLVGLAETKTDLLNTSSSHAITSTNVEGVFFYKTDGGTVITSKVYKDGSQTGTANAASAMTTAKRTYEMYWDGASLKAYLDNVLVGTFTSGLPDGDLTISINYRAGEAAAVTSQVEWLRVIQIT